MKNRMVKRWYVVCIVWGGVFLLTFWNVNMMRSTNSPKEQFDIQKGEMRFLKNNSEMIKDVLHEKDMLFNHVESTNLGLISVESSLRFLADAHHLKNIKIFKEAEQSMGNIIPITFSFEGTVDDVMGWIEAFRKDKPYLYISNLKMAMNDQGLRVKSSVTIHYRYEVAL